MVVDFVTPFRDRTLELLDDQAAPRRTSSSRAPSRRGRGRRGHPARRLPAGRLRRAARRPPSRVVAVPTIGVAARHPGALGQPSSRTTAPPSATPRRDDPDAHHAGAADRGRPPTSCATSRSTSRRSPADVDGVPGPPARHRHLPPGLAGRLREPRRGHLPAASSSPTTCAAGRSRSTSPSRTTRTSRSPTTSTTTGCSTGPSRSSPTSSARSTSTGFHLYVHDDAQGWRPTHDFALAAGTDAVASLAGAASRALAGPRERRPLVDHAGADAAALRRGQGRPAGRGGHLLRLPVVLPDPGARVLRRRLRRPGLPRRADNLVTRSTSCCPG